MKTIATLILILFSYQLQAACKCNCEPASNAMCAPSYDLAHPCNGMCEMQTARSACPTVQVFNQTLNKNQWITLCTDD